MINAVAMMRISVLGINIVLSVAPLLLFSGVSPAQNNGKPPATTFLSHTMGESFAQWLGITAINLSEVCAPHKDSKNPWSGKPRVAKQLAQECALLSNIRDTGSGEYSEGPNPELHHAMQELGIGGQGSDTFKRPYHWIFRGGVLARLTIYKPDTERDIAFLVEKYGTPATRDTVMYHNAFGAKWECERAAWKTPDETTIYAEESMEGLTRFITVVFSSKVMAAESETQPKRPNPY
jgi:hypothetical protein